MTKIIEFIKLHYLMHHSTLQCTKIYLKRSLGALKLYSKANIVRQIDLRIQCVTMSDIFDSITSVLSVRNTLLVSMCALLHNGHKTSNTQYSSLHSKDLGAEC